MTLTDRSRRGPRTTYEAEIFAAAEKRLFSLKQKEAETAKEET